MNTVSLSVCLSKARLCSFAGCFRATWGDGVCTAVHMNSTPTVCRAVGGDPAKTPPLSSLSELKTACNLIPPSSPSTKLSTETLGPAPRPASDTAFRALSGSYSKALCTIITSHAAGQCPLSFTHESSVCSHGSPRSAPSLHSNLLNLTSCLTWSSCLPAPCSVSSLVTQTDQALPQLRTPSPSQSPPRPRSGSLPLIPQCRPKRCPDARPAFLWPHRQSARVHFCS